VASRVFLPSHTKKGVSMRIQERNYRSIVIFSDQDRGGAGFVRYEQIFLNCNAENQIVCTVSMEEGVTLLV
jgi:hypothetical protein